MAVTVLAMRSAMVLGLMAARVGVGSAAAQEYPAKGLDVFDPQANGMAQVNAGLERAKAERKSVVVMFGANWCGWCHRLNDSFESDPVLIAHFRDDFVLVKVDVNAKTGKQRNRDVVERFGKPTKLGLPTLLLLAPDGTVLATQKTGEWETRDGKAYRRSAIQATLAEWAERGRQKRG